MSQGYPQRGYYRGFLHHPELCPFYMWFIGCDEPLPYAELSYCDGQLPYPQTPRYSRDDNKPVSLNYFFGNASDLAPYLLQWNAIYISATLLA